MAPCQGIQNALHLPPTSSTAWLSSLTGVGLERHGIPGVVFKVSEELINVFEYQGALHVPMTGNIFTDAAEAGYIPVSIMGDWEPYDCTWRKVLLSHSEPVRGYRFYTDPSLQDGMALCRRLLHALSESLAGSSSASRRLVWCFIDADRHIHLRGYDNDLVDFLKQIDQLAVELARKNAIVVAHSDHGLSPTRHNGDIQKFFDELKDRYGCAFGGAGRTRWIYTEPEKAQDLNSTLAGFLPETIRVCKANDVFAAGTLARSRVGDTVIIAQGEEFVTFSGHVFDHGSLTDAELYVPFAQWMTG